MAGNTQIDILTWERLGNGDEQAFSLIVHAYNRQWMYYVTGLLKSETDALDVLQEVWVKVWLGREQVAKADSPGAWIKTILTHTTLDFLKAHRRRLKRHDKMPAIEEGNINEFWKELDSKSMQEHIEEAVDQLPARQKEIFRMARLEGYSRKQIAERLNISENTVRNHLAEAMNTIQTFMNSRDALLVPLSVWFIIQSVLPVLEEIR